ncbi:hypothetical protein [Thermomonospora echinospora]|uniref:hypothetical protein n=1 Tax=Thermomonospora echinospora TaxID=1992 RepID=UPI0011B05388|nr:hypothetical protein [Thermomonospora echinospora]
MSDEQKLSETMRIAMADVRPPADLAAAGLARGHRMRRRARLLRAGGTVLGLSAIAVAGVSVLGDDSRRTETLTPQVTASSSPATPANPVPHKEVVRIFRGLLPAGGRLTVDPPWPGIGLASVVDGQFDDGKGPAAISLSIRRVSPSEPEAQCVPVQIHPYDDCKATRRSDGSVLVLNKGFTRPQFNTGEKLWYAELSRPGGILIHLGQYNSPEEKHEGGPTRPDPPLTLAQMTSIVTDPAWVRVAARLPAPGQPVGPDLYEEHPGEKLMATLRRLLPAGGRITHPQISDGYVSLIFGDAKGRTTIDVNVQTWRNKDPQSGPSGCRERTKDDPPDASCTKRTLSGGAVVYLQQRAADVVESGVTVRIADVMYPDGLRVVAMVANGTSLKSGPKTRDTPALTLEQLYRLVTDPSWRN